MDIQENLGQDTDPMNPNTNPEEIQGAGNTDQKPRTPDDDEDLGSMKEDVDRSGEGNEPMDRQALPELDKENENDGEDDGAKPTDFDIDESTG